MEVTFVDTEAFDPAGVKKDEKIIQAAELVGDQLVVSHHKIKRHTLEVKGVRSAAREAIAQESTIGACDKDRLGDEVSDDLNGEDETTIEDMAVTRVIRAFGEEFMLKEIRRDPCLGIAMDGSEKHNG